MAHPPDQHSDLTFRQFIEIVRGCSKGIKLDFKSLDSVKPCLEYLNKMELNLPVILNADIFQGENSPQVNIDPDKFLRTCIAEYPNGVLSLGWTTKPCTYSTYTRQNVRQAVDICQKYKLECVHFALRLSWSTRSIDNLLLLHEMTNCSFTFWSHENDCLTSLETLFLFRHFFDKKYVFYDLPSELVTYFNKNKNEYEIILLKSSDNLIRSYFSNERMVTR